MSLSPAKAVLHSKKHAFPLGYSAHFVARLHDAVGRSFDYANIDLSYRLNRLDIVHITRGMGNDSYIVKAARQGNAILKVAYDALYNCHCTHCHSCCLSVERRRISLQL